MEVLEDTIQPADGDQRPGIWMVAQMMKVIMMPIVILAG
jgi:hypothetical protein